MDVGDEVELCGLSGPEYNGLEGVYDIIANSKTCGGGRGLDFYLTDKVKLRCLSPQK